MKPTLLLPALFLFVIAQPLVAQREDLTKDKVFFSKQSEQYQRWLEHTGLSRGLKVRTVEVEPQQLALYLEFPTDDPDTVAAVWDRLKTDYAKLNTGLSLERALFFKTLQFMEVRQSVANVQLYDTYDTRKEPCFYRGIYVKDAQLVVDSSGCKSKKVDIYMSPGDLQGVKKPSPAEFQRKYAQDIVFDKIYQYAKQRYERQTCVNRHPSVGAPQTDGNVMRFEVTDLCKEVLKDAQNDVFCDFLNRYFKECNWIQREKLSFTFVYQAKDNGFVLKCEVEGKVGSGFYDEVGRGGYFDMEIDFDGYLEDYAKRLQSELKQVLAK